MATEDGFVVYQRGQSDNDSDIWDDSALIKAYDNAVAIMKAKMSEKEANIEELENSGNSSRRKSKRKRKKKTLKTKKRWKVGERCRAVFTEDAGIYDAVILSINEEDQTCFVRYTGYGNEEQQSLANLLPASRSNKQNSDIENMSDMEWAGQSPSAPQSQRSKSRTQKSTNHMATAFGSSSFMAPPPFSFPGTFGPWPRSTAGMGAPSVFIKLTALDPVFCFQRVPLVPPPPPPMVEDLGEVDNEALCSMLLSWYMSGYHTGYYQGLKQGHADSMR
ncbi:survival of motor neuron protein-like [Liolophura sinensis]|uniref:survival of motor neuron protein-like n=1 Tax=Liolophura sinensis TaxID=3198878 RepID=UPI0031580DD8